MLQEPGAEITTPLTQYRYTHTTTCLTEMHAQPNHHAALARILDIDAHTVVHTARPENAPKISKPAMTKTLLPKNAPRLSMPKYHVLLSGLGPHQPRRCSRSRAPNPPAARLHYAEAA
jgi:hypothetical protein